MTSLDVIVIGGGPAGSTAATMLARRGLRVVLCERERFPRDHVGESLLPASMPILEALGVLPAMEEAGFLKKWGATMVWGSSPEPWSWYFRETNLRYPHAYQVWRPDFDAILLANARSSGVDVREGTRVTEVVLEGGAASGIRAVDENGRDASVDARFVVDASGQAGMLARTLGLRQADEHFRNLAVYAYFDGARRLAGEAETNIFIESYEHGWLWNIPLHSGWMSVGAVVDSAYGRDGIGATGAEAFLGAQIAGAPHTSDMLRGATLVRGPEVIRDWSYIAREVTGPGWAICGDAACFIDPLFSTGVHLALSSGMLAAAYTATALSDAELAAASAPVYRDLYLQQYSHFRELARLFYASNRTVDSYFWEVRRVLADDSLAPREAFVRATAGQSARGYERAVLAHGDLPRWFERQVSALEGGRAERTAEVRRWIASREALRRAPALEPGTRVERRPVLGDGIFEWGQVLVSPSRPEGVEVSAVVEDLVHRCDGVRTVAGLVTALAGSAPDERVLSAVLRTIEVLYADGIIADLREVP